VTVTLGVPRPTTISLLVALFGGSLPLAAQSPTLDLYRPSMSFCCRPADGYHDLDLFKDAANNRIGNAVIHGATIADLQRLGLSDLAARP